MIEEQATAIIMDHIRKMKGAISFQERLEEYIKYCNKEVKVDMCDNIVDAFAKWKSEVARPYENEDEFFKQEIGAEPSKFDRYLFREIYRLSNENKQLKSRIERLEEDNEDT
jgi:hypothetical protein